LAEKGISIQNIFPMPQLYRPAKMLPSE
jgi:hypothetical protein